MCPLQSSHLLLLHTFASAVSAFQKSLNSLHQKQRWVDLSNFQWLIPQTQFGYFWDRTLVYEKEESRTELNQVSMMEDQGLLLFSARNCHTDTAVWADALSRCRNQEFVCHLAGRFLLTASLSRFKASKCWLTVLSARANLWWTTPSWSKKQTTVPFDWTGLAELSWTWTMMDASIGTTAV